jgi:pyruvate/2-oxoglutarate dehydrogenase complex dihydrolipoamide acyltransferase (E2) component
VVELVAGGVTVDLEAPVSGRLVAQLVDEDASVAAGTVIAEFVVAE